jgi:hypothetical protein
VATGSSGIGVYGFAPYMGMAINPTYGGYFEANHISSKGVGVYGEAKAVGVSGKSTLGGYGVKGEVTAHGYAADLYGPAVIRTRAGVPVIELGEGLDYAGEFEGSIKATATSADGIGVHGISDMGKGVSGYSNTGYGVYGYSQSGNGVRGSSPDGYAGAFMGQVRITDMPPIVLGGPVFYGYEKGTLGAGASSARFKEDIRPLKDDFHKILEAEPKSFVAKEGGGKGIGFIAEEFDALGLTNLLYYRDGEPFGVRYDLVPLYMLEVLKDQVETTKELKAENDSLKQRVEALEKTIHQLAKVKELEL